MTRAPAISVIIPHLNQPKYLEACLKSLDAQTLDRSRFEVLVVDNGSDELPVAVVAHHAGVRLLEEQEPGPGIARNRGTQAALGEIFAFIDADCRAHPDWLKNALSTIENCEAGALLGGDVQIWREHGKEYTPLEAYESVFAYRFKLYIETRGFSGTGNLVVRRSDFGRVGPFAGIKVAEDTDWGHRALAAGCKFQYVPSMIVYHPARKTIGELFAKWDRHVQHAANLSDGSAAWKIRWIVRAIAVLASPGIDWAKIMFSDRIYGISARTNALFVLMLVRFYRFWRMLTLVNSGRNIVWNQGLIANPLAKVDPDGGEA